MTADGGTTKIPRDLSGRELAAALSRLGYRVSRQTGSHLRLSTVQNGEHHLTIPAGGPLKPGTLSAIMRAGEAHHGLSRPQLLQTLFAGKNIIQPHERQPT